MATVKNNFFVDGIRGKLGDSIIFRTMRGKTFISVAARKPNKKKESTARRNTRTTFREASEWAQITLLNPEKKAYYQQRARKLKLPNAYTAAVTDYMRKPKVETLQQNNTIICTVSKPGFTLLEVKADRMETTGTQPRIVTQQQKDKWIVQYTYEAGNAPASVTLLVTNNTGRSNVITTYG